MQFFDIFKKQEKTVSTVTIDSEFKLPIDYLDAAVVHTLSPIVATDLEMDSCVYEIALKPEHEYAKAMIKRIKTKYTTHVGFLENTQEVVSNVVSNVVYNVVSKDVRPRMACPEKITEIWKDVYEVEGFHDRYSFIDIPQFKYINHVSGFMGFWTIVNLMSPLLSLFLPLIFMVAPFVLLKIQGVPIDFSSYLGVLKIIAKSHFIGKTLNAIGGGDFSINNVLYLLFTLALYGLQMYQNVKACIRFYKNISVVNERLITIKEFADYSVVQYDEFLAKFQGPLEHYAAFCDDVRLHRDLMMALRTDLEAIKPFEFSIGKCFEVGNLLKCYYGLFDIEDHRRAVAYAVGFDSYLNLVSGLNMGLNAGYLGRGTFIQDIANVSEETDKESTTSDKGTSSKKTQFVDQVYPSHAELDEKVPNTMDLSANIIITGPNASGKTTQLKTTAINIILTQQFGVGFYTSCELVPYTHIHSYLNIPDTSGRDSLFQAEARRCKEILDVVATSDTDSTRHFCVFDELFSGTNAEEATSASFGFLKYLQGFANVDFILTTHFVKLCQKVEKAGALRIANYMMDAELCDKEIVFTYDMIPGISKIKAAKLILIQMGFPDEIILGMV